MAIKREGFVGNTYGFFTVTDIVKARSGAAHYEVVVKCVCGNIRYSRKFMLEAGKHTSCGCRGNPPIKEFDRFGNWTVIKQSDPSSKRMYDCACICGTEKAVQTSDLRSGKSRGCQSCAKNTPRGVRGLGYVPFRAIYNQYKRNSEKAGREFTLTFEEAKGLFSSDCHYCLSPPSRRCKGKHELWYNGIDRVDNTAGYTIGNVVSCCTNCNFAKGVRTYSEYKDWLSGAVDRITMHQRDTDDGRQLHNDKN